MKHKHGKAFQGIKRKRSVAQAPQAKFPDVLEPLRHMLPNAAAFTAYSRYATAEDTDSADEYEAMAELPYSLYELYDSTWQHLSTTDKEKKSSHCSRCL